MPRRALQFFLTGLFLSLGAPVGLYIIDLICNLRTSHVVYIYSATMTAIAFSSFGYLLGRLLTRFERLASIDELTQLFNRRYAVTRMERSLARGDSFYILMMDLDHFKRINDTYGHGVGDNALKAVAEAMNMVIEPTMLLSRFGGEEFLAAVPFDESQRVVDFAERIRHAIRNIDGSAAGFEGHLTISIGIALVTPEITLSKALGKADQGLYFAKQNGRDQVKFIPQC